MIRIVVLVALAAAFWRKVSRKRRYALGIFTTALLGMGGAVIGGLIGDLLVEGSGVKRDAAAGVGATALAVLFVAVGELAARRSKGWPLFGPAPEKPRRTLRRR